MVENLYGCSIGITPKNAHYIYWPYLRSVAIISFFGTQLRPETGNLLSTSYNGKFVEEN